jgi:hypothetical protein
LKVLVIGAVLLAFVRTLNSYDGIPVPVLLLLALLGLFSYVTRRPCSAAASIRWAATWKRPACPASTCRPSSCGSSASWA